MNCSKIFILPLLISASFLWAACDAPEVGGGNEEISSAGVVGSNEEAAGDEPGGTIEPAEWLTDYDAALVRAKEEGKPVLINFTGSDWCPPCIRLKQEVFDDQVFHRYANEKLVLVELDFPRRTRQSQELVEQNRNLQQRYVIEGFPTLIVLDPEGTEQRRHVGYRPGGTRAFVQWVEE